MAVTSKASTGSTGKAAEPNVTAESNVTDDAPRVASTCVVAASFHVGNAVNGKVCSYHAMHYDAHGNRR